MPRLPHRRTDERSALAAVTVHNTDLTYTLTGIDWPVSGDETLRYEGRHTVRTAITDLWHAPSVHTIDPAVTA